VRELASKGNESVQSAADICLGCGGPCDFLGNSFSPQTLQELYDNPTCQLLTVGESSSAKKNQRKSEGKSHQSTKNKK
jgi:hypothetical protein